MAHTLFCVFRGRENKIVSFIFFRWFIWKWNWDTTVDPRGGAALIRVKTATDKSSNIHITQHTFANISAVSRTPLSKHLSEVLWRFQPCLLHDISSWSHISTVKIFICKILGFKDNLGKFLHKKKHSHSSLSLKPLWLIPRYQRHRFFRPTF